MIQLKPPQLQVFLSPHRFRLLAAGRRFGKTFLAQTELLRAAWGKGRIAWYVAPTYKQAKRIAWNPLKELTKPYWAAKPNETDLRIELAGGGTIALRGADAYDSLRGEGLDFVVLDEFASMAPAAWYGVLRPMLADRLGQALFIGTPQGFNHFYDLYTAAESQPDWATFHYTTEQGGNVAAEELARAAREMDERLYRQEFRASFEQINAGRAYWAFDRTRDVRDLDFDPHFELCWSLDFNIDPASSVLCQVVHDQVNVLDEISLKNSNTGAVCEEFARRAEKYLARRTRWGPLDVKVYGDATGDSRKSNASRTDWQIVRDFFNRNAHLYLMHRDVPSSNPPVKDRVNCVNAVIANAEGRRRLNVDPRCRQLIRDLEQVCWKTDSNGNMVSELDHSDPTRTHMSDALGYLIAHKFPMWGKFGEMPGFVR
jgi:hypothetical protein